MRHLALVALTACQGTSSTVNLDLVTAPGSTLLDGVQRLRLTVTEPRAVFETERGAGGFDLAFDVEATGLPGALILEGLDDNGALIATGASPPFPLTPIEARIVLYVAAPMSIEPAPVTLEPARELVSTGTLSYGAILAGGRHPTTQAASDRMTIYNAYVHTLTEGAPLPAPRVGVGLAVDALDRAILVGGTGPDNAVTATVWRFDTRVSPAGGYAELADDPALARTGERVVRIGDDRFLVTGSPALDINLGVVSTRSERALLNSSGTGLVGTDGVPVAVFANASGIVRFRDGEGFTTLSPTPRPDAGTVTLPDRTVLVVGAGLDATRVDPASGELTTIAGFLPISCPSPETAVTSRHVLVGCGTQTYVYDADSLALLTVIAKSGVSMTPLPNDQVLMMLGAELSLFTPSPPE
ncbi:MAG: hypothetical protein JWP01_4233 [Myxococcales bacterium]|nr:hypothetical protein [Myxococcales bacterium]